MSPRQPDYRRPFYLVLLFASLVTLVWALAISFNSIADVVKAPGQITTQIAALPDIFYGLLFSIVAIVIFLVSALQLRSLNKS